MEDTEENYAPYGPAASIIQVINRIRDSGVTGPINAKLLERIHIPEGNIGRTMRGLRFLILTDEQGNITPEFEALRRASTGEYKALIADIIRNAYKDVFELVNPAEATYQDIDDAFRHYTPRTQRARMVTLFLGLCKEAGIIMGDIEPTVAHRTTPSPAKAPTKLPRPIRPNNVEQGILPVAQQVVSVPQLNQSTSAIDIRSNDEATYARIWELVKLGFPRNRQGTREDREHLIQVFTAGIDLLIKWVDKEDTKQDDIMPFKEV